VTADGSPFSIFSPPLDLERRRPPPETVSRQSGHERPSLSLSLAGCKRGPIGAEGSPNQTRGLEIAPEETSFSQQPNCVGVCVACQEACDTWRRLSARRADAMRAACSWGEQNIESSRLTFGAVWPNGGACWPAQRSLRGELNCRQHAKLAPLWARGSRARPSSLGASLDKIRL